MKRRIYYMDIGLPKEYNKFDGYMLMKFTTSGTYQEDFLNGKLFFNTADFFAQCDDQGRGDSDEGNTFIVDYENPLLVTANLEKIGDAYAMVVRDYKDDPEAYKRGTVWEYSAAINRRRKIISMYTLFLNIANQTIDPFPVEIEKEFGHYGILVLNRQEFFERVIKAITSNSMYEKWGLGFVNYLPQEQQKGLINWHPFIKKQKFSYQKEFRISFVSNDEKAIKLDLGCSLRDIAVPIMAKDLNEIFFKDGKLLYPTYE